MRKARMTARFLLGFLVFAFVGALAPSPSRAQTYPGPASPSEARIYFYREVGSYMHPRWTGVFLNDEKVGDLGPGTYFHRDVAPGTYKVGVDSDVPYPDQYRTVTLAPGGTIFIRVYNVEGYGVTFSVSGGGRGGAFMTASQPSVFGNMVVDPVTAAREMAGLQQRN
jgi:Protein of unknown function (DUF2846)